MLLLTDLCIVKLSEQGENQEHSWADGRQNTHLHDSEPNACLFALSSCQLPENPTPGSTMDSFSDSETPAKSSRSRGKQVSLSSTRFRYDSITNRTPRNQYRVKPKSNIMSLGLSKTGVWEINPSAPRSMHPSVCACRLANEQG